MTSSLERAHISALVKAALWAPSGDNCQPWRFVWNGRHLEIYWLVERAASFYDVNQTASWIALGASLANLRIAAHHLGVQLDQLQLFPRDASKGCVARMALQPCTPIDQPLFPAMSTRCANRRAYQATPLTAAMREELFALASAAPGMRLDLVETSMEKQALAAVAARNEAVLFEHRILHDGLYRWLRWTADAANGTGDGLPVDSLELHPLERPGFRLLGWWPAARLLGLIRATRLLPLRSRRVYEHSAAIGLVSVSGKTPEDIVRGGELIERLWLTTTLHGLAFQPITGIICLWWRHRLGNDHGVSPAHRRLIDEAGGVLASLLPDAMQQMPLMLFRVGYAPAATARAPRQSVNAVLTMTT